MKRSLQVFLSCFFTLLTLHLTCLLCFHFNENFKVKNFEHGFKVSEKVEGLDSSCLDKAFSQPYHFFGAGKQMTAFLSQDGNYVLKLFNPMRPQKPGWIKDPYRWMQYSSFKWISREWFGKKKRLAKLFDRGKLAYEKLPLETALLYVHFAPSEQVTHFVHVTDKKGREGIVSMANTPFVLQERATLVPEALSKLDEEGLVNAKKALQHLFARRIEEGITDRIQTLSNNYGFVGDRAVQIDFGRIHYFADLDKQEEEKRILESMNSWLTQHHGFFR